MGCQPFTRHIPTQPVKDHHRTAAEAVAIALAVCIAGATGCLIVDGVQRLRKIVRLEAEEAAEKTVSSKTCPISAPRPVLAGPRLNFSNLTFRSMFERSVFESNIEMV